MTDEMTTTIRIYTRDRSKLLKMFGSPAERAFRLALAKAPCDHPEGKRMYTTAIVNGREPGEALNQNDKELVLSGFKCMACGNYVFPVRLDDDDS